MEYIKSPMNYVGGKYKLLPQIINLLPKNIDNFIDLFCGGLDVGINIKANRIILNDIMTPIIKMYEYMQSSEIENIIEHIENNICTYQLSKTNQQGYLKLRENYNINKHPLDLMTLIAYCYNNQIRFNKSWGFNRAFGMNRSEFNPMMKENLFKMLNVIKDTKYQFTNYDFGEFDLNNLTKNDFVYLDPPYLITYADYSIQALWDDEKEKKLLNICDSLNKRNIKFALSNVLTHNGKTNNILVDWSGNYTIHKLNHNYHNCNADKKVKTKDTVEILITNY